jgi:RimJ/RimL family protein N-acetyltransferase
MNKPTPPVPAIFLRPPEPGDADILFPLIYQTQVTETLVWNGPASRSEYQKGLRDRREATLQGREHYFAIVNSATDQPIGTASLRPEPAGYTADIGLWIGAPYHGKGFGTQVIGQLIGYGFGVLNLEKIEGCVFVGNWPSRRIFEKNGFQLEGTIRIAVKKRGVGVDEWLFGILREEYLGAMTTDND